MSHLQYSAGRKALLGNDGRYAECVAPSSLGLMLQGFPDAHASLRFRRVTPPQMVNIMIGDFIAQQAGRYELKGRLPAADIAIRQHANLNESSTGVRMGSSKIEFADMTR